MMSHIFIFIFYDSKVKARNGATQFLFQSNGIVGFLLFFMLLLLLFLMFFDQFFLFLFLSNLFFCFAFPLFCFSTFILFSLFFLRYFVFLFIQFSYFFLLTLPCFLIFCSYFPACCYCVGLKRITLSNCHFSFFFFFFSTTFPGLRNWNLSENDLVHSPRYRQFEKVRNLPKTMRQGETLD